jgi:hypothetical protein
MHNKSRASQTPAQKRKISEAGPSDATQAPSGGFKREQPTQRELYEAARKRGLPGRSRMTKAQLARALGR